MKGFPKANRTIYTGSDFIRCNLLSGSRKQRLLHSIKPFGIWFTISSQGWTNSSVTFIMFIPGINNNCVGNRLFRGWKLSTQYRRAKKP